MLWQIYVYDSGSVWAQSRLVRVKKCSCFSLKCAENTAVAYLLTSGCETETDYLILKLISSPCCHFFRLTERGGRKRAPSLLLCWRKKLRNLLFDLYHFEVVRLMGEMQVFQEKLYLFFCWRLSRGHQLCSVLTCNAAAVLLNFQKLKSGQKHVMLNVL